MSDDKLRIIGALGMVYTIGHDLERINVQAGIGFIQHGHDRLEQGHLQNFRAFLFSAGEPLIHRPLEQRFVQF